MATKVVPTLMDGAAKRIGLGVRRGEAVAMEIWIIRIGTATKIGATKTGKVMEKVAESLGPREEG